MPAFFNWKPIAIALLITLQRVSADNFDVLVTDRSPPSSSNQPGDFPLIDSLKEFSLKSANNAASLLAIGEVMISRSKIPINILMTLTHHSSQTRTIVAKLSQTRARLPGEGGKLE